MSDKLVIFLNGASVIEYDRAVRLPGHQRQYLDKMDRDMDDGIEMNGQRVVNPDLQQRAQYIAMHLAQAIINDNEALIAAMCAYLATRIPELKQVKAVEQDDKISLDLVINDEQQNQVAVQFDPNMTTRH